MRSVGGSLAVGVVLDEDDGLFALFFQARHDSLSNDLTGAIPQQSIACTDRLRGGVLGVGVVDVQPCAVRQDSCRGGGKCQLLRRGASNALGSARWCEVVGIVGEK